MRFGGFVIPVLQHSDPVICLIFPDPHANMLALLKQGPVYS